MHLVDPRCHVQNKTVYQGSVVVNPYWWPSHMSCTCLIFARMAAAISRVNLPAKRASATVHRLIPLLVRYCSDKCCNSATDSKFTVSVRLTDELAPWTAGASYSSDSLLEALATSAFPLVTTDPAASTVLLLLRPQLPHCPPEIYLAPPY